MFSAPDILTKKLTGYSYEGSESDEVWHSLIPAPPRKSWLGGLFGR
jgi:hypothetical protein